MFYVITALRSTRVSRRILKRGRSEIPVSYKGGNCIKLLTSKIFPGQQVSLCSEGKGDKQER